MAAPSILSQQSEYNQQAFAGGMNLLGDDSRLQPNQYRIGFDLTNRYDVLDSVLGSVEDQSAPQGKKQELLTFGNYIILFVAGLAYYRLYNQQGWIPIEGFSMSTTATRFWTVIVPVTTTNYLRLAATTTTGTGSNGSGAILLNDLEGAAQGNTPGILVQDNINQPQFIFFNGVGALVAEITQTFNEWSITFTDATNTVVAPDGDNREYVPIGNSMTWDDGILYIVSQDGTQIYRSVSGRPLDFVVNVTNILVTTAPYTMIGGGDAATTSYSVGVGGISSLRQLSSGGIFVAASNACFSVTKNMTPNAPTIFGEYTFIRKFLFNATCLSDRVIFDTIGDTRFIDLTGVRSFNAIEQTENQGRNSPFTAQIKSVFGSDTNPIIQDANNTAGILFNDYELYAVNTIFGPCLAKYDTVNNCWTSFDLQQTNGKAIKILAKIELEVLRLFAITSDDRLFTLYIGPTQTIPSFRHIGVCANILYANSNLRMANPKNEVKPLRVRAILNNVTEDCDCDYSLYVNNRLDKASPYTKEITFEKSSSINSSTDLADVNTQLVNLLWTLPNSAQGWKVFGVFSWTDGSLTQFSMELADNTPMNPLNSQKTT